VPCSKTFTFGLFPVLSVTSCASCVAPALWPTLLGDHVSCSLISWFQPSPTSPWRRGHKTALGVLDNTSPYYFRHANVQTRFLGDLFFERNWAVCTIDKMAALLAIVERVLDWPVPLKPLAARFAATTNRPQYTTTSGFWRGLSWERSFSHFYLADAMLFRCVLAAGGCVGSLPDLRAPTRLRPMALMVSECMSAAAPRNVSAPTSS